MHIDARTGVVRPRSRYVWAAVTVLLPVIVIGGGSALFINTYIAPLPPGALERPLLASYHSQAADFARPLVYASAEAMSDATRETSFESETAGGLVPLPRPRAATAAIRVAAPLHRD